MPLSETVIVFAFCINGHFNFQLTQLLVIMTQRSQPFNFLRGIHGIAHQLPQKDLMIGIEKFFNDREICSRY